MKFRVRPSTLSGEIRIPPSKSHTIRAAVIAALSKGPSVIHNPLVSADTLACVEALKLLGATFEIGEQWKVSGFGGKPTVPDMPIDVKNSGTTMNFLIAVSALADGEIELTGDESICRRPVAPLLKAILKLGAVRAESKENNGCPPVVVRGRMLGGSTEVEGISSQYVSALLLIAPLLKKPVDIKVTHLHEKPYIDMTLAWLKKMGIEMVKRGRNNFEIPGNQCYFGFESAIPADFSTATFPLVAAAVTPGSSILIRGLDMNDTQGDKRIFDIIKEMGGSVEKEGSAMRVKSGALEGMKMDLNDLPDSLPAMAVLGCFADGKTELANVGQARIKETDRITVMCEELKKMGAEIEERKDGLMVRKSKLKGAEVDGRGDHRIVMALTLAGLAAEGETVISSAESVAVTFPEFFDKMKALGADISKED